MDETQNTGGTAIEAVALNTVPLWRAQTIRALEILGTAVALFAGLDLTPYLAFLDPKTALILGGAGVFAKVEAPQIINFAGDLFDNGKLDKSFPPVVKLLVGLMVPLVLLTLTSCGTGGVGFRLDPPDADACLMVTYGKGSSAYSVGPCAGPDGRIDRYRAVWTNGEGVRLRSTYFTATKRTAVEYSLDAGKTWLPWGSKAGISLDGAPAQAHIPDTPA